MHRQFRKRLDGARGVSEFVIALNVDIRGFSDWSLKVDSAQTALFIKKVYAKLIDQYFSQAAFFKPTGDGLLVVLDFKEEHVRKSVRKVVSDSMKIVDEFETLCADEPAVNFDVPPYVGIGISRGAASRLVSGRLTLDYSGRVLNLASRLMDLARPRGVVFDTQLGFELLAPKTRDQFREREVYLRGVAPRTPIEIQCWPADIQLPPVCLAPIGEPQWKHVEHTVNRDELVPIEDFALDLPSHPPDLTTLTCGVEHDQVTSSGRRSEAYGTNFTIPVQYVDAAGQAEAHFKGRALASRLAEAGVGRKWPVNIKVSYRVS